MLIVILKIKKSEIKWGKTLYREAGRVAQRVKSSFLLISLPGGPGFDPHNLQLYSPFQLI